MSTSRSTGGRQAAQASWDTTLRHRDELLGWLRDELLPHAHAEEGSIYAAAGDRALRRAYRAVRPCWRR